MDCWSLEKIIIPQGVTYIGNAFVDCKSHKNRWRCFQACYALRSNKRIEIILLFVP